MFALCFLGALAGLSRLEFLTIDSIDVAGTKALSKDAVIKSVERELEGSKLLLFPKRNIFIADTDALSRTLQDEIKVIDEVRVSFRDVHRLVVNISERTPHYLWCGENVSDGESCFFLDQGGFIFSPAPKFTGIVYLRVYGALEGQGTIGNGFLDEVTFRKIGSFVTAMKQAGFNSSKLIAKGDAEFELYLENGTKILFNSSQNLDRALDNLLLVFSPSESVKKKTTAGLLYIDLRFNNKVFFKEKES